jgi:nicotinamidase-related amidase
MENTLVLLIDFQEIFKPHGLWPVPKFNAALENALKICEKFKNVITTRYIPPKHIFGEWKQYFKQFPKIPLNDNDPCYDLAENVPDDFVISVPKFGKWQSISKSLRKLPEKVIVCGVSTDCCVLSTVLPAVDSGVKVYVVSDACAAGNNHDNKRGLDAMKGYYPNIEIVSTENVLNEKFENNKQVKTFQEIKKIKI